MPRTRLRHQTAGRSTAVVLAAIAVVIAAAALVIASTRHSTRIVTGSTSTTSEADCAPTASGLSDFVAQVHGQGNAAYASQPLAITGNGTYTLIFGPVSPRDAARFKTPWTGGLSFPIPEDQFSPQVDHSRVTKVAKNGETYIRAVVVVSDFKAPCAAMRALIQY